MKYKIFVGVIFYNCPEMPQDKVETIVLIATDWTEAEEKTRKYAFEFTEKTKLIYQDFKVFVQAHYTNHVGNCVHFVRKGVIDEGCYLADNPKMTGKIPNLNRKRIEIKIKGKSISI